MYKTYGRFYVPKHKYEVIFLLNKIYPKDIGKFSRMSFEQCLAIYYHYRERDYGTERKVYPMDRVEKGTSDNSSKVKQDSISD